MHRYLGSAAGSGDKARVSLPRSADNAQFDPPWRTRLRFTVDPDLRPFQPSVCFFLALITQFFEPLFTLQFVRALFRVSDCEIVICNREIPISDIQTDRPARQLLKLRGTSPVATDPNECL